MAAPWRGRAVAWSRRGVAAPKTRWHPTLMEQAAAERPLLSRLDAGREEIERLLDEERRALMRLNEARLERYARAADGWGAQWPGLSRELQGRPLGEAHEIMVERATAALPEAP
jgi:hypothetical protein